MKKLDARRRLEKSYIKEIDCNGSTVFNLKSFKSLIKTECPELDNFKFKSFLTNQFKIKSFLVIRLSINKVKKSFQIETFEIESFQF